MINARIGAKVGPFYVSTPVAPFRPQRPAAQRPQHPTQRPSAASQAMTARQYRDALAAHERAMDSIRARAARDGVFFAPTFSAPANVPATTANPWHVSPATITPAYNTPTVHRARTQRPVRPATTHRPLAAYILAMVAVVVGGFVALGVLGMILTAAHVLPATQGSDNTPHPAVSHSAPAHTGHAAPRTSVRQ